MDIKAINTAIITGSFTNDQLSSIIDAVKYARSQLTKTKLRSFSVGDRVKIHQQQKRHDLCWRSGEGQTEVCADQDAHCSLECAC